MSTFITEQATSFGVVIENIQAEDNVIHIELEPVAFSALLKWLNHLREKEGFQVSQLSVMATRPGVIAVQQLELLYQP